MSPKSTRKPYSGKSAVANALHFLCLLLRYVTHDVSKLVFQIIILLIAKPDYVTYTKFGIINQSSESDLRR